jgi:hypothetical protein
MVTWLIIYFLFAFLLCWDSSWSKISSAITYMIYIYRTCNLTLYSKSLELLFPPPSKVEIVAYCRSHLLELKESLTQFSTTPIEWDIEGTLSKLGKKIDHNIGAGLKLEWRVYKEHVSSCRSAVESVLKAAKTSDASF